MPDTTIGNEQVARAVRDVLADGVFLCVRLGPGGGIVDACRAAVRGGLTLLEITLTSPGALEAMTTTARDGKALSVAYRCYWRGGHRHCRWYGSRHRGPGYRGYGYRYYGPLYPEAYRTGSSRWWQEMDREDRGGRGRP